VINALSDFSHPCQVLSDLYTLRRAGRDLDAMTVAWVGDGNHALHSWIEAVALFGFELRFAVPDGLEPDAGLFLEAERRARGTVRRVRDPLEAALGADVLCTDAWVRIGRESRVALRRATRASYRIDERLVAIAKPDAVLMHGFSAPPGDEVAPGVLLGSRSLVTDQAENRLHLEKALMAVLVAEAPVAPPRLAEPVARRISASVRL
jgi:ornithine carbamoyltransferase